MKKIFREPLFHFLLIGIGIFLLYEFTGIKPMEERSSKTVIVDEQALLQFMQYRSKAFEKKSFREKLANMSPQALARLIDDFVREEVLYREALALGLDQEDYIIRRRLMSKLEFLAQGFSEAELQIDQAQVEDYFKKNQAAYYVQPYMTFTHVFFDKEKHGIKQAQQLAEKKLKELNQTQASFTQAPAHGDRFLYHTNYVERVLDYISSHFGQAMAEQLVELKPSDQTWQGPFESPYGYHVVMMTEKKSGRTPELSEIFDRVKQDAKVSLIQDKKEATINQLLQDYDIQILYPQKRSAETLQKQMGKK